MAGAPNSSCVNPLYQGMIPGGGEGYGDAAEAQKVEQDDSKVALVLSHGVPYGKYLELSNGGRYAIVGPTVMREGYVVMRGMAGLMDKAGGPL